MKDKSVRGCRRGCLLTSLVVVAALAVVGTVFSTFGGFGTGPSAPADEFAQYVAPISEIAIPEGTRIVALGEATHGNREFQELKLDVFQNMVEQHGVRAFALEADTGGCEAVNRYIHGGDGTAQDAAKSLVFTIYRTDQMAQLIEWMRAYNQTATPGNDLRFYGFDMQSYEYSYQFLVEEAQRLGLDVTALKELWEGDDFAEDIDVDQREATFSQVKQQLEELDDEDAALALHLVEVLQQNIEIGKHLSDPEGVGLRDQFMSQNVLWIARQEEARGNQIVFVSAHNGHIYQEGTYYGSDMKVMGNFIADEVGADAYYAIGTDFFKATVNLPKGDGRMTHTFYSYDPLAKAAESCGYDKCWLDFSSVPTSSELIAYIDEPILMGSVGEGFSPLMYVLPQAYRIKWEPSRPYDSMIFVPYAHPTETWPR